MTPEIIAGRYVVLRAVGRGGMGTVWLCRDELLGRDVAVKQVGVLPGESVPDLARALREARSSAALHHPHVVTVFDAIEEDDHIWLVMEYVPGETLGQQIAREGRLDPERVAVIGAHVADGLAAAHARGTIHRDVKPGNVLLSGETAKISDFGISRTQGDDQLTVSGVVMGTPLYFSPEIARGEDPSPAADVWALGATLYHAVEGVPPIADRGNAIATLAAITSTRPAHPKHAVFLAEPIGRMLDPNPSSRWTMEDAAHALRQLHKRHGSSGTLTMTAAVERTPSADSGLSTTSMPPASAAPPAAAEPSPVEPPPAEPATPAPGRDRRSRWPLLVGALVLLLGAGIAGVVLLDRAGDDPPEGTGSQSPSREQSAEPSDSETTSDPPSTSSTSPASPTSPTTSTSSTATDATDSVAVYYDLLPDDPESAWEMLGPEARSQAGGYDGFAGWWATIEDVRVDAVTADEEIVTVELTYTSDGGEEQETRQLEVEPTEDGWLIARDLGAV